MLGINSDAEFGTPTLTTTPKSKLITQALPKLARHSVYAKALELGYLTEAQVDELEGLFHE